MYIGILTFHRAINYGAVLQCFALYKTLKNLGHDVEVIDYRPKYIERYRVLFYKKDFLRQRGIGKIRYLLSCLLTIASKKQVSSRFDRFIKKFIRTSNTVRSIKDIPNDYDVIFFGSDQIWGPEHSGGLDPIYYGQFPKNKSKFLAYAASIARTNLIEGETFIEFNRYIRSFDKISTREKLLQDFLLEKCLINSQVVCDPSLLLERSEYEKLAKKPRESNYVLLFCLVDEEEGYCFAQRIAKQMGAKVIQLKAVVSPVYYKSYIRGSVSIEDFLGYILKAQCVVTNSFHATSFSIILGKDFYTLSRSVKNERSQFLLDKLNLSDRLVDSGQNISFKPIDYEGIDLKIDAFRKESLNFILDAL